MFYSLIFRIKDEDALLVDEGKSSKKIKYLKKSSEEVALYVKACREFINSTITYFKDLMNRIVKIKIKLIRKNR
jgi:hypothetical protein